jgi:hypothetical protein
MLEVLSLTLSLALRLRLLPQTSILLSSLTGSSLSTLRPVPAIYNS